MIILTFLHKVFSSGKLARNKGKKTYTNVPIPISNQLSILQADGLVIPDLTQAEQELGNISYFRLSEYLNHLRDSNYKFGSNHTMEDALSEYYFDKQLRAIIFQAIQSIEISLRTRMIQCISMSLGTFWFMDKTNFKNKRYFNATLGKIRNEVGRNNEPFILDFYNNYSSPDLPPVWKTLEVISFGTLSKLYENLADSSMKQAVASSFNVNKYKFFVSWIQSIAVLRNLCCHHNRVWNRNFVIHPQMPTRDLSSKVSIPDPASTKLYNFLCILCYLEKQIHPTSSFPNAITKLLAQYPHIDISAMGFPANWQKEPLWQPYCS